MARTLIGSASPKALLAGIPGAGTMQLVWTALTGASGASGNSCALTGNELLLLWNTHASTGFTCAITTSLDQDGRTGDITAYALAAGDIIAVGPIPMMGFAQSSDSGRLWFESNSVSVKASIILLRGQMQYA